MVACVVCACATARLALTDPTRALLCSAPCHRAAPTVSLVSALPIAPGESEAGAECCRRRSARSGAQGGGGARERSTQSLWLSLRSACVHSRCCLHSLSSPSPLANRPPTGYDSSSNHQTPSLTTPPTPARSHTHTDPVP